MSRPFRIELNEAKRGGASLSGDVSRILADLVRQRAAPGPQPPVDNAITMWSGVEDIQKRLEITKSEISALQSSGHAGVDTSRAADELRAVVSGTEEATDTILAAAEAVDEIAQRNLKSEIESVREDAQFTVDRIVEIFEACNFQDITGQRVSKVAASLQFIEERIATMVDAWKTMEDGLSSTQPQPQKDTLLNGPALKGDLDVVSQDDVDAMFP